MSVNTNTKELRAVFAEFYHAPKAEGADKSNKDKIKDIFENANYQGKFKTSGTDRQKVTVVEEIANAVEQLDVANGKTLKKFVFFKLRVESKDVEEGEKENKKTVTKNFTMDRDSATKTTEQMRNKFIDKMLQKKEFLTDQAKTDKRQQAALAAAPKKEGEPAAPAQAGNAAPAAAPAQAGNAAPAAAPAQAGGAPPAPQVMGDKDALDLLADKDKKDNKPAATPAAQPKPAVQPSAPKPAAQAKLNITDETQTIIKNTELLIKVIDALPDHKEAKDAKASLGNMINLCRTDKTLISATKELNNKKVEALIAKLPQNEALTIQTGFDDIKARLFKCIGQVLGETVAQIPASIVPHLNLPNANPQPAAKANPNKQPAAKANPNKQPAAKANPNKQPAAKPNANKQQAAKPNANKPAPKPANQPPAANPANVPAVPQQNLNLEQTIKTLAKDLDQLIIDLGNQPGSNDAVADLKKVRALLNDKNSIVLDLSETFRKSRSHTFIMGNQNLAHEAAQQLHSSVADRIENIKKVIDNNPEELIDLPDNPTAKAAPPTQPAQNNKPPVSQRPPTNLQNFQTVDAEKGDTLLDKKSYQDAKEKLREKFEALINELVAETDNDQKTRATKDLQSSLDLLNTDDLDDGIVDTFDKLGDSAYCATLNPSIQTAYSNIVIIMTQLKEFKANYVATKQLELKSPAAAATTSNNQNPAVEPKVNNAPPAAAAINTGDALPPPAEPANPNEAPPAAASAAVTPNAQNKTPITNTTGNKNDKPTEQKKGWLSRQCEKLSNWWKKCCNSFKAWCKRVFGKKEAATQQTKKT